MSQSMMSVPLKIKPRFVIDLRDWYQSTFMSPRKLEADGFEPGIVRPKGNVLVLVEAVQPGDTNWPFPGVSELVLQRSPSGLLAFHGRVKLGGSVLAHASRTIPSGAKCRMTILVQGFQPSIIEALEIPDTSLPPTTQIIPIYPATNYSFPNTPNPPTLLEGSVGFTEQKSPSDPLRKMPLAGVKVSIASGIPPSVADPIRRTADTVTGADGRFLFVLDYIDTSVDPKLFGTATSPVQLSVQFGDVTKNVSALIAPGKRVSAGFVSKS